MPLSNFERKHRFLNGRLTRYGNRELDDRESSGKLWQKQGALSRFADASIVVCFLLSACETDLVQSLPTFSGLTNIGGIVAAVDKVGSGSGVVVLTDMFGGTPSNLAISIMDNANIEVIAGVNLPLLIKLASVRSSESMADAVIQAQEAGRKYINVASALLAQKD